MRFMDRTEAGRALASSLEHLRGTDLVVLGLPRGGVPVAYEVAKSLGAPLDVIVVRKLGVPFQPELAMGAIGEGGIRVRNEDVIRRGGITQHEIDTVEERERADLDQQARRFRDGRPLVSVAGRTAIVVDDGIATGATMRVALQAVRRRAPARLVMAVPVAPPDTLAALLEEAADEAVCLETPIGLGAIGYFYRDFHQMSDAEVTELLARAPRSTGGDPANPAS